MLKRKKALPEVYYHGESSRYNLEILTLLRALYVFRQSLEERRDVGTAVFSPWSDHSSSIGAVRPEGAETRLQYDLRFVGYRRVEEFNFLNWSRNRNRRVSPRNRRFLTLQLTENSPSRRSHFLGGTSDDSKCRFFVGTRWGSRCSVALEGFRWCLKIPRLLEFCAVVMTLLWIPENTWRLLFDSVGMDTK